MAENIFQRTRDRLLSLPLMTWVLLGFFITFFFFFVVPVFFDPSRDMQFKPYVLVLSPIGYDFRAIVSFSSTWIHTGVLVPIVYPAFTLIFFAPFTFLGDETGYKLIVFIILLCYILITWVLPQRIHKLKSMSAFAMLILITGLPSYGLQFELERGQWNVIAMTFCLLAVYIFHEHPKRRWLAYLMFTISVQLKLFPAIFVFALIEDASDWRNNLKRIVGLGVLNVLLLFILGVGPVINTVNYMVQSEGAHVGRPFNLSISSFVLQLLTLRFLPHKRIILWLQANTWLPQLLILVFFGTCFGIILWQAYKRRVKGFDPYVFMACTIGAFIIPALSFDYKLAAFPAAVILSIPAIQSLKQNANRFLLVLLTLLFSLAYSSTLYSYVNKPDWLGYNLPALLLILVICTILSVVRSDGSSEPLSAVPPVDSVGQ